FNCHSPRKAITSSRLPSGSGPGWFSRSQVRTSSRNSSSDGDSVRSIEGGAYTSLAGWPGRLDLTAVFEAVLVGRFHHVRQSHRFAAEHPFRVFLGFFDRRVEVVPDFFDFGLVALRSAESTKFLDLAFEVGDHDLGPGFHRDVRGP